MDSSPSPDYGHVYHNGSGPGGDAQLRDSHAQPPDPAEEVFAALPARFALCAIPLGMEEIEGEAGEGPGAAPGAHGNGTRPGAGQPLHARPSEWWRHDIQLADVVGWGLEFVGLAVVYLNLHDGTPGGGVHGRFSSAEAARRLYSRLLPMRLVYT